MKTTLLSTLFALLISFASIGQADQAKFQKALGKTLSGYADCKTAEDFTALSQKFERIAKAEGDEWLPLYYQAHCIVISNFMSDKSLEDRDAQLDIAQTALDKMSALEAADQSEVMVLQSMIYTGRLILDPATRGQKYSMLSGQAIGKALALNPNNPRAQYSQIANDHGSAQWFGKDLTPYCEKAKALYDGWDALETNPSPLVPHWGKDQTLELSNSCN